MCHGNVGEKDEEDIDVKLKGRKREGSIEAAGHCKTIDRVEKPFNPTNTMRHGKYKRSTHLVHS